MKIYIVNSTRKEPLTLDEVKQHCRIDTGNEDALLSGLICAAREYVETKTGISVVEKTCEARFSRFPDSTIVLPNPPLQEVLSVKAVVSGVEVTIDPSSYYISTGLAPSITPVSFWPATDNHPEGVRIQFKCGYAQNQAPSTIKQAMLLLISFWNENREAAGQNVSELPFAVSALLSSHRVWPQL